MNIVKILWRLGIYILLATAAGAIIHGLYFFYMRDPLAMNILMVWILIIALPLLQIPVYRAVERRLRQQGLGGLTFSLLLLAAAVLLLAAWISYMVAPKYCLPLLTSAFMLLPYMMIAYEENTEE